MLEEPKSQSTTLPQMFVECLQYELSNLDIPNTLDAALGPDTTTQVLKCSDKTKLYSSNSNNKKKMAIVADNNSNKNKK